MIHNTPRPTINYTDEELAILYNPKVLEEVKNSLYESKLVIKEEKETPVQYLCIVPVSGGKDSQACLKMAVDNYGSNLVFTRLFRPC